ncbi:MAG: PsiF family protein [Anaeromyxobacteraceae bacterium]
MTRTFYAAFAALAILAASPAFAGPQQDRMKACNVDAGDKKGDERKAFMKKCLSDKAAEHKAKLTAQQEKMKTCNADAKTKQLAGAERKKFMSECLSAK